MKKLLLLVISALFFIQCSDAQQSPEKPRVLVLTDIENEPDDAESLVRFLLYSNMFDVEGLVATTSCWQRDQTAEWRIHEIVDAYGEVKSNLDKHEKGYPEYDYLKSIVKKGYPDFGMNAVGEGKDSEGSELIIEVVDRDDPRPVWVPIWGGANCLAQALWKVSETRSKAELDKFVAKLCVYTISDQDNSGPWMRNTFPDLMYIASPGYHENGGNSYFFATWTGIAGERHYKFPSGADTYIIDNGWVDEHIQNHGPLGAQYPDIEYIMEGDTPSFLYLINNGLNSLDHPDYGGWGGRYELYRPRDRKFFHVPEERAFWTNAVDWVEAKDGTIYINEQATIWRWRTDFQNDFAARMDWTISDYADANHQPVPKLGHKNMITCSSGEKVSLSAKGSKDPDGDQLSYEWIYYPEPGNFLGKVTLENSDKMVATFTAPEVTEEKIIHVILRVTDNGSPNLARYQRVIITVKPS